LRGVESREEGREVGLRVTGVVQGDRQSGRRILSKTLVLVLQGRR